MKRITLDYKELTLEILMLLVEKHTNRYDDDHYEDLVQEFVLKKSVN